MSKKDVRLSAEAAAALADAHNQPGAVGTAGAVRPNVVTAIVEQYLLAIERKARSGGRRVLTHEVGMVPMRVSQGEKAAAKEKLTQLGYTVTEEGVRW